MNYVGTLPPYPPQPPKRPIWVRTKLLVVAGSLAIGAAAGFILAISRHSPSPPDTKRSAAPQIAPNPATRCITSWNQNNASKDSVARLATVGSMDQNATAYVNVGFSSLFPDRCLITVANPVNMYAQQYMEDTGGHWSFAPSWTGSATDLDTSVTTWNAKMGLDGTITSN